MHIYYYFFHYHAVYVSFLSVGGCVKLVCLTRPSGQWRSIFESRRLWPKFLTWNY